MTANVLRHKSSTAVSGKRLKQTSRVGFRRGLELLWPADRTSRLPAGDEGSLSAFSRCSAYALTYSLHRASYSSTGRSATYDGHQMLTYNCQTLTRIGSMWQAGALFV